MTINNLIKNHKLAFIGFIFAFLITLLSNIFELDPFDNLVLLFKSVEQYEIDEVFIGTVIFLLFLIVDLALWHRNQQIEVEKVKIYKAMIASSHHILNNFLNQMLIFKMTAEDTPGFDPNVLKLYDEIIEDAKRQLEALSSIKEITHKAIKESVFPK